MTEQQTVEKSGVTCRNCGHVFDDAYCPKCGQEASTSRFTLADIFRIVLDAFDFEHGLLRLAKELTLRPAELIRDYLAGKRARVYGPLRYLLMTAAITALAYTILEPASIAKVTHDDGTVQSINYWASSWTSLLVIVSLPFYALSTRVLFRKWGYNYAEHLVLNMFVIGHINLFGAFFAVAFNWTPVLLQVVSPVFTLLYPVIVYTTLSQRRRLWAAVKGLAASLFGMASLLLLVLVMIVLDMQYLNGALGLAVF